MAGYISLSEFTSMSVMPASDIAQLEVTSPGWIAAQSDLISRHIDARLRKRYRVPFVTVPVAVQMWVTSILTHRAYLKRGVDPTDVQSQTIVDDATRAQEEVLEAANCDTGLFDLPLLSEYNAASGAVKGAPLSYSEQSPYVWMDNQYNLAKGEDRGY